MPWIALVSLAGCGDDMMDPGFSSMPNSGGSGMMTETGGGTLLPTTTMSNGTGSAEGEGSTSEAMTSAASTSGAPSTDSAGESTGVPDPTNTTNNTTNGAMCNNGTVDANEQCDGGNLNGFTCESLGNTGGTLACDPVTCTFDTSLCTNDTGGTSG